MTLRTCLTTTTVEADHEGSDDRIELCDSRGEPSTAPAAFSGPVIRHLDRLRSWAGVDCRFRVTTRNSFPMGAGIASSASGFAALALAVAAALERDIDAETASCLARASGSGSAARSVLGGYVEWPGRAGDSSAATQILPPDHWDLRDVIAVLDTREKRVSSRQGHRLAETSPYFETRLERLPARLAAVRQALTERDFDGLAAVVEREAIDLHLIAMSSRPPVFYWRPGTLTVLERVRDLRATGVEVCATMDAGANVHVLCTAASETAVVESIEAVPGLEHLIRDGVGNGPRVTDEHLY